MNPTRWAIEKAQDYFKFWGVLNYTDQQLYHKALEIDNEKDNGKCTHISNWNEMFSGKYDQKAPHPYSSFNFCKD